MSWPGAAGAPGQLSAPTNPTKKAEQKQLGLCYAQFKSCMAICFAELTITAVRSAEKIHGTGLVYMGLIYYRHAFRSKS